jgi:hypothetical protein
MKTDGLAAACCAALLLSACGGGSHSASSATGTSSSGATAGSGGSTGSGTGGGVGVAAAIGTNQQFSLSGSISGLTGSGLVLSVNSTTVTVAANATSVTLAAALATGTNFTVGVLTQPAGMTCSVDNSTGQITSASLNNVVVTCRAQGYAVGGVVSGLTADGLVLANGGDSVRLASGATSFVMPALVAQGGGFAITVKTQPTGLSCSLQGGSGIVLNDKRSDIQVICTSTPYSLSGNIAGLTGTGLVLTNGADSQTVPANTTGFLLAPVADGSIYKVVAQSSPPGLQCWVAQGSGTIHASSVADVKVACAGTIYTVGGTITGLTAGGLTLVNGNDMLAVASGATSFIMPTAVPTTGAYDFKVQTQPQGLTCTITNGNGVVGSGAVTNVGINCAQQVATIGGTITGMSRVGMVLLNNGDDPTGIAANASAFSMQSGEATGSDYSISVGTQPYGIDLGCTLTAGSGTANADVSNVVIGCAAVTPTQSTITAASDWTGMAVDSFGDIFIADAFDNAVYVLPNVDGVYGTPSLVASGLSSAFNIAIDGNNDVFIADYGNSEIKETTFDGASYSTPVVVGSGFSNPRGVDVDETFNLYVADTGNNAIKKVPFSNGAYGTPIVIASGLGSPVSLALDPANNVYVVNIDDSTIWEIPNNAGTYGAPVLVGSGFSSPEDIEVDDLGNIFVADTGNLAVKEIPFVNGAYGPAIVLASGYKFPNGVELDPNGRLYVLDSNNKITQFHP